MSSAVPTPSARSRLVVFAAVIATTVLSVFTITSAQAPAKKALTVDDYTRWRSISGQEISGDGKWVAYDSRDTNAPPADAKPVLHLLNLETNEDVEIANATGAAFSADSKWVAYQVDPTGGGRGRGGRGGRGRTPVKARGRRRSPRQGGRGANAPAAAASRRAAQSLDRRRAVVAGHPVVHLLARRRAPDSAPPPGRTLAPRPVGGRGGGGGAAGGGRRRAAAEPSGPRGVDVMLHDLITGRDQLLGSVGDIAFNKTGDLLAYTVDAAARDGNGLFVLDLADGPDQRARQRREGLQPAHVERRRHGARRAEGRRRRQDARARQRALVYPERRRRHRRSHEGAPAAVLDPAKADGFPKGWVVSDRAVARLERRQQARVLRHEGAGAGARHRRARRGTDEVADVDVWNTTDDRIQSVQMIRADTDRNFTYREAFDASAGRSSSSSPTRR